MQIYIYIHDKVSYDFSSKYCNKMKTKDSSLQELKELLLYFYYFGFFKENYKVLLLGKINEKRKQSTRVKGMKWA